MLWFLILLSYVLLIPFRISLFINSMLCWCNFLCVVCDALYEQANLKVITCVQKLEIIRIFFHGDNNDDDDDDSDDGYYYLIFLIIFHFICLLWPVVQTRHNFNSSQCACEGKYSFLSLFLVVGLLCFSNVACRCIVKCESVVNEWEKKTWILSTLYWAQLLLFHLTYSIWRHIDACV